MYMSCRKVRPTGLVKPTQLALHDRGRPGPFKIHLHQPAAVRASDRFTQKAECVEVAIVLKDTSCWLVPCSVCLRCQDGRIALGHAVESLQMGIILRHRVRSRGAWSFPERFDVRSIVDD